MRENHLKLSSQNFQVFASQLEEVRRFVKVPPLFQRRGLSLNEFNDRKNLNEICILRRWNSHTPSLFDVLGGGYLIRWNGSGTIVDPGCSFLKILQTETPYFISDINMVIVTHDHIDHCHDFGTLIGLFREYNKWLDKQNKPPRTWDLLMSLGVADQFNASLINPDNAPFLRWNRVIPPGNIEQVQPLPSFAKNKSAKQMQNWKSHLSAYSLFCQKSVSEELFYHLKLLPASHKELLGSRTAFGLQFTLLPSESVIVISGDTGYDDRLDLADWYKEANLLILHVGTMEGTDGVRLSDHLGLDGVTKVLSKLVNERLKLVVLTEWGYEFGRIPNIQELGGRLRFTKLVEERLNELGCTSYFAAVSNKHPVGKIPILPADISLRISLPNFEVWSIDEDNGRGGFASINRIWAEEKYNLITFRSQ